MLCFGQDFSVLSSELNIVEKNGKDAWKGGALCDKSWSGSIESDRMIKLFASPGALISSRFPCIGKSGQLSTCKAGRLSI